MTSELRRCSKCKKVKPHSEFYNNKGGLHYYCKLCLKSYEKKRRGKNDKQIKKQKKEHREAHKDEINAKNREYHWDNRDDLLKKHKQYYKDNKVELTRKRKERDETIHGTATRIVLDMRRAFKRRGIECDTGTFNVQHIELMLETQSHCPCCHIEFDYKILGNRKKNPRRPSIDRTDPAKGYIKGNVGIICWRCNNVKRDGTANEHTNVSTYMKSMGVQ